MIPPLNAIANELWMILKDEWKTFALIFLLMVVGLGSFGYFLSQIGLNMNLEALLR